METLHAIQTAPAATFIFLITVVTSLYDLFADRSIQARFILHPYTVVHQKQYYRLLTSGLIHGDIFHLFLNMFVFYNFAFMLERMIGTFNFSLVYVFSLVVANLPLVFKHKDNPAYYALGASGAI